MHARTCMRTHTHTHAHAHTHMHTLVKDRCKSLNYVAVNICCCCFCLFCFCLFVFFMPTSVHSMACEQIVCGFVMMLGGAYGVPLQANMYPQHLHPGSPAQRMMGPPYQQYPPPQGQTSPLPPGMHPYPNPPPMSPHAGSPGAPPMFPASPQGAGAMTGRAVDGPWSPDHSVWHPALLLSGTVLTVAPVREPCRLAAACGHALPLSPSSTRAAVLHF